jgi:hypothetical protein
MAGDRIAQQTIALDAGFHRREGEHERQPDFKKQSGTVENDADPAQELTDDVGPNQEGAFRMEATSKAITPQFLERDGVKPTGQISSEARGRRLSGGPFSPAGTMRGRRTLGNTGIRRSHGPGLREGAVMLMSFAAARGRS